MTDTIKDNPKKPYKAIVGAVVAGAAVLATEFRDVVPLWIVIVASVVVAGGGVYIKSNPKLKVK